MKISRSVVDAVRSLDPPGRFLEKDPSSGKWFDIGDKKAVEKTSQALRDGAASLRRQLSQDLSDPDFLSAVFDMEGAQKDKPSSPVSGADIGAKKEVPTKTHRRVKSSPSSAPSAKARLLVKKLHRSSEGPMSPRGSGSSICIQMHGKPPQSPIAMSPRSAGGSPRQHVTAGANPKIGHRRVFSQGAAPVQSTRMGSPVCFGPPNECRHDPQSRSSSFEYNEPLEHNRPPPVRLGSPNPHSYAPPPMLPAAYPSSPYGEHRPYLPPVSPRWSPRAAGYARSRGQSLSPHPYYHPDDYHRRHSPDLHFRPPISPRNQAYQQPHPHYPPPHYQQGASHTLAVPCLGNESPRMYEQLPMAPSRQYYPQSPRNRASQHGGPSNGSQVQSIPIDFTPPQGFSRRIEVRPCYSSMHMEVDVDEKKQDDPERTRYESYSRYQHQQGAPFDEHNQSSASPSAVVDVVKSNDLNKDVSVYMSPSRENEDYDQCDEYPSDEELDPAGNRLSPLPFDHHEDPSSLMELPGNILSLPISPCGPHDGGMGYCVSRRTPQSY
ncbi:hypothetical protein MHU86_23899 [Fragilaria crotonensis]|nr:hypothetical protein MHU86_23899 [Fragilaria crotonensis]